MTTKICLLSLTAFLFFSCKKKDANTPEPEPQSTLKASKSFEGLIFNTTNAYFASDGSMKSPVDSATAKINVSPTDLTFFFNFDYTEPGFIDPVTRSKDWNWNDYKKSWLSAAVETRFYSTSLTKTEFDAAKSDESKIAAYFSSSTVTLAPHGVFPTGSCIGGRESSNPVSLKLVKGLVFGFKNTFSGKRGLLYIRTDQEGGWPLPVKNTNTKVDILKEG